ncbi:MAG TPA: FkbM family methyltransferase [Anaerolineales bacterium]|nr:FkbM family methyltransferase [Anaerolineales bacterium]
MAEKERFRDYIAFKIINLFQSTFKARLMDKLPLYKEAAFCKGVYCYIASVVELRRSERLFLPEVYAWLESFKPGEVFYDIGANIGMFSLTVAKLYNGQVKIYAFEPSFSTFDSLVRNVIGNRFGDVIIPSSIALGRMRAVRTFNYTDIVAGASVHTLDAVINQTGEEFNPVFKQQVISYSLDDLVEQFGFPVPTHIKIDVDGGELEIIEGMRNILSRSKIKSVLVEITEAHEGDEQVRRIMDIFKETGFRRSLNIPHSGFKTYPMVADILFTKDWNIPHDKNLQN